jgi:hypothetical protein
VDVPLACAIIADSSFSFSTRDHAQLGVSGATSGMAERFLGVDLERRFLEYECTNPPQIVQTCLSNLSSPSSSNGSDVCCG